MLLNLYPLQTTPSWIDDTLGVTPDVQFSVLRSIIAIVVLVAANRLILRYLLPRIEEGSVRYRTRKLVGYVTALVGFIVVGRIWYTGIESFATFLGLVTAGLAIALRDLVASFAAWLFIIWRRPFQVGDRIQVGDVAGDVIDQRIFQFSVMEMQNWVDADQPTGRIVHVPNSKIFTEPQANYTRGLGYIWHEIPVLVTFESNWERAKSLMDEIGHRHADAIDAAARQALYRAQTRFMVANVDLAPRVYTSVDDSGVLLTLRVLTEPRRRRAIVELIWEDILRAFREHDDIDFAYPSVRYYDNRLEGKPGARAPVLPGDGEVSPFAQR
jgi:small-conductance mechanosensitive channel